jgi:geranylgeranyl pyrophosphate synthase
VIQAPLLYIGSLPSKGVRDKVIDALNIWLHVPLDSLQTIKKTIHILHTASLMLDDFEDGSNLRRGRPATHTIFGAAQTINTANFQLVRALQEIEKLNNAACQRLFSGEIHSKRRNNVKFEC